MSEASASEHSHVLREDIEYYTGALFFNLPQTSCLPQARCSQNRRWLQVRCPPCPDVDFRSGARLRSDACLSPDVGLRSGGRLSPDVGLRSDARPIPDSGFRSDARLASMLASGQVLASAQRLASGQVLASALMVGRSENSQFRS